MIKLNAAAIEEEINNELKAMRLVCLEECGFAIAQIGNVQVQILLTKNPDDHVEEVGSEYATVTKE